MAAKIPQEVLDYLAGQKTLTLATTGLDGLWAATLTYVNDESNFFFWIRPGSTTDRQLDQNPTAAFAIDDYAEDWRQTKGIQGRGRCSVVEGEEIARVADLFGQKYPELRPGSTSAVVFFRIQPSILEFIDNSRGGEEGADFGAEYRRETVLDMPALDEGQG
jgi:uncharacterized protein YhbP (UPF0306 family)